MNTDETFGQLEHEVWRGSEALESHANELGLAFVYTEMYKPYSVWSLVVCHFGFFLHSHTYIHT